MKHTKLFFAFTFALLYTSTLYSAANHNRNVTAAQLASTIQGQGITITNPVITRGQIGGANSQVATFTNGIAGANLQIDEGILLTASTADEAFSTNNSGRMSLNPGNINNVGGLPTYDADLLSTINQTVIRNQVIFEFDVTLDNNTRLLLVDYQFASDEYPEWVGSAFNDAFGFFISGGDLASTLNIARVVDDSIIITTSNIVNFPPVNINNVNRGAVGNQSNGSAVDLTNSQFYIPNGGTDVGIGGLNPANVVIESEFDGFTNRLHATLDNLTPGQTYHFKMALADTSDAAWDAGVFVNKIIGVRVPEVCYDYDVRIGNDISVASENNNIEASAFPGEQLNIGIALQSLEGELALEDVNLTLILQPNSDLSFAGAQLSPDSINSYIPIPPAFTQSIPYAQIPIGEDITQKGGIINSNQVIFANYTYDFNGSANIQTHFELTSSLNLTLNGITIPRTISTGGANPTLTRCPTQTGYHPQWESLNVERVNSNTGPASENYLLYTQISGRPFDVEVVSYDPNNTAVQQAIIDETTIEIEMIDSGKYTESNQSIFTCREPSRVGTGQFVHFNVGDERIQVPGYNTTRALKNTTFRLWYLTDGNGTAVNYSCATYNDTNCFRPLYLSDFQDQIDIAPYQCQSSCTGGGSGCYECLKTYFARPICARDNFSVRPEAYRLAVSDNNQEVTPSIPPTPVLNIATNNNLAMTDANLSAGYSYRLDGNATLYNSDSFATGYYGIFNNISSDLISRFNFNMPLSVTCNNTDNTDIGIVIHNGRIQYSTTGTDINFTSNNLYAHPEVGNYLYHIEDNNWTIVDQARYPFKTFPGTQECTDSTSSISADGNSKSGCQISSTLTTTGSTYTDLALRFNPYRFAFAGLRVRSNTNPIDNNVTYYYMNDLNNTTTATLQNTMAAKVDGNITAQALGGLTTTNFVAGCAATDLFINMERVMFPAEQNITSNLGIGFPVGFQQRFISAVDNNTTESVDDNISYSSRNFTANGTGQINLYYNFERPVFPEYANVIDVNFTTLHAASPNATATAHLNSNFIPDENGTGDLNTSRYFYYAQGGVIASNNPLITYDSFTQTFIRVAVYCEDYDILRTCTSFGLPNANIDQPIVGGGDWYRMVQHNGLVNGDGMVNTLSTVTAAANISLTNNIFLDNNGSSPIINITYPLNATRPIDIRINIGADPWLTFAPDFTARFLSRGFRWKGEGNTAHVIDDRNTSQIGSGRTNW